MIYVLVFIILFLGALLIEKLPWDNRFKNIWWYFELLVIILLWGLRYNVGGDSLAYSISYKNLPSLEELLSGFNYLDSEYQPLWLLLNAVTKTIGPDFYIFQLTHALLVNSVIFWFIKKYSLRPFLFVVVYFFMECPYFNTEILRESLAVSCFLIGFPYLISHKWLKYYFLAIIAYGFHASAICLFFFPILIYVYSRIQAKTVITIIIVSLLILSLTTFFSSFMFFVVQAIGQASVESRLELYSGLTYNRNGLILAIISIIVYICFLATSAKSLNEKTRSIVALYVSIASFMAIYSFFGRLLNYLSIPFLIIIVNMIYDRLGNRVFIQKIGLLVVILYLIANQSFYYCRDMSQFNGGKEAHFYNRYYPYYSIFNKQEDVRRNNIFWRSMEH